MTGAGVAPIGIRRHRSDPRATVHRVRTERRPSRRLESRAANVVPRATPRAISSSQCGNSRRASVTAPSPVSRSTVIPAGAGAATGRGEQHVEPVVVRPRSRAPGRRRARRSPRGRRRARRTRGRAVAGVQLAHADLATARRRIVFDEAHAPRPLRRRIGRDREEQQPRHLHAAEVPSQPGRGRLGVADDLAVGSVAARQRDRRP